jgi:competence protein ComGC
VYDSSEIDNGIPAFMIVFFVLFAIVFVAIIVLMVVAISRNWKAAKAAGLDPLTAQTQLMAKVAQAPMLQSPADRLASLEELYADGAISAEEHQRERTRILGEV